MRQLGDYSFADIKDVVSNSKILLVGTGGVGCELLKCLAQAGFKNIEIVDLDTIDVSNLNRQFLFKKIHVGKPKAEVARSSILKYYPSLNITAHCASIIQDKFSVPWFKQFRVVINALDNVGARSHVNRMCLAAGVPLLDTGTGGFLGQVEVIIRGKTKCYECLPRGKPKTFPSCTIRNTPTEPIHCIVWSKHLFSQLFGEPDDEAEVSPDTADPELAGDSAETAMDSVSDQTGSVTRTSTRLWAKDVGYDPVKLFNKLFNEDILYLLSLKSLWEKRRPPQPLTMNEALKINAPEAENSGQQVLISDQRLWSLQETVQIFERACLNLKNTLQSLEEKGEEAVLHWDKDDKDAMDFVASCANIRSYIFGIPQLPRYDIKSMAGNIIPAVSTTNAATAGMAALHLYRLLHEDYDRCRTVYVREAANHKGLFITQEKTLFKPKEDCFVCSLNPEVTLHLDVDRITLGQLYEEVFKGSFQMAQPEIMIKETGSVIISEDDELDEKMKSKPVSEVGVKEGTVLLADDFLQTCKFFVSIVEMHISEVDVRKGVPLYLVVRNLQEQPRKLDLKLENGSMDIDDVEITGEYSIKRANENGEDLHVLKKRCS